MNYIFDIAWEHVTECIADNTPLDWDESRQILSLLSGAELEEDHYLWGDLRDWMRRASEYTRTGITPPAAAS
jgi:hypothetical protein